MEILGDADAGLNTVHIDDVASAIWSAAQWMAKLGRQEADKLASVSLKPCRPVPGFVHWVGPELANKSNVEGLCSCSQTVSACLFNVVDDGATKAEELLTLIGKAVGCKTGLAGVLVSQVRCILMRTTAGS